MPIVYSEDRIEKRFELRLSEFSGGLNTRDYDSKVADNELTAVRNFNYDKRGALKVRKGFTKINSTAIGSVAIKSVGGYYKTGATALKIAIAGTSIYKAASTVYSEIKAGLTGDGLTFDLHQFMNKYFMCNGNTTDKVQVYNGTDVYQAGYTKPGSAVTAVEGAAGVLENKVYQYKVTYYYDDGESNANDTATSITPTASKKVELSNIPVSADARVTQRRLYRTIGDGTTFKLLTTINDNTTTTYSDNVPDSGLGADLEYDNDAPPAAHYCISHKNRMWYITDNSSTLWYSKALHPEAVPSTYYWDVGRDDGDIITGIAVNLGALVIFKRYSTWIITGDIPTGTGADMVLEKVNPTIGCVAFKTIQPAGNDLFFFTPNLGVQRLHRIILATTESFDAEALSSKIEPTINALNQDQSSLTHAVVYNHRYYLFVPYGTATYCDTCLVLDLRNLNPEIENTISWTIYDNMNFACSCLYLDGNGEYFYVGSAEADGFTYAMESGYDDDGARIEAYAITKYHDFDAFDNLKIPRSIAVHGRASEDYSFTIRRFHLSKNTESQYTDTFTGGGVVSSDDVLWDEVLFDSVLFDADGAYTNVVVDIAKSAYIKNPAHKIKLKIEDVQANNEFSVFGFVVRGFVGEARMIA